MPRTRATTTLATPYEPRVLLRDRRIIFDRPPETPEAVALELMRMLNGVEGPARAQLLNLYAECLTAARGERRNHDGGGNNGVH